MVGVVLLIGQDITSTALHPAGSGGVYASSVCAVLGTAHDPLLAARTLVRVSPECGTRPTFVTVVVSNGTRLRRVVALTAALAVIAGAATSFAATSPGGERLRLTREDMALARGIVVQKAELSGPGWRVSRSKSSATGAAAVGDSTCSSFQPAVSRFTVTGHAETSFLNSDGSTISSEVQVHPSAAQAVGDFRATAKPGIAACMRAGFEQQAKAEALKTPGLSMDVLTCAKLRTDGNLERTTGVKNIAVYGLTAHVVFPDKTDAKLFLVLYVAQKDRVIVGMSASKLQFFPLDGPFLLKKMVERVGGGWVVVS
jgi:hypothetical protein